MLCGCDSIRSLAWGAGRLVSRRGTSPNTKDVSRRGHDRQAVRDPRPHLGTDWLDLVWALKSFYFSTGRHYALCIHEDGSLKQFGLNSLRRHFPAARIILRAEADAKLAEVLRAFPRSLEFRNTNLLAPKVFDFIAFLESDRMGLFDSDLLFFAEPTIYLQRVEDPAYRRNTFNADCGDAYTVEPDAVRAALRAPIASPREQRLWSRAPQLDPLGVDGGIPRAAGHP